MRAVMRYRHIPYEWVCCLPSLHEETAAVRPAIMPVVQFPDGSFRTDSTPMIYALEEAVRNERSVLPTHAGHAFLSHLIEDMADEWMTKCLFHYRFAYPEDADFASAWVQDDALPHLDAASLHRQAQTFRERQISRMALVGCTPVNAPLIEASYQRVLSLLEPLAANGSFLFGTRPSLADFGLAAQLRTLATDPTPQAIMRRMAPRTEHWIRRLDDASGVQGAWIAQDHALPAATRGLLDFVGAVYLPFLAANAQAVMDGHREAVAQLGGHEFRQASFRYQAKCWRWLKAEFLGLSPEAREAIHQPLKDAGCWDLLAA